MSSDPNQKPAAPETFWQKLRNWGLGILIVLFVLYLGVTRVYSFIDSLHDYASDDVNHFYTAMKSQDYATAFGYLAPNLVTFSGTVLTQTDFIQHAKDVDAANVK